VFAEPYGEPIGVDPTKRLPPPGSAAGIERDWDERRRSQLETERWERLDRRVERYALLVVFFLGAVATIAAAAPGAPVAISVLAGLRLRALNGHEVTSFWDWLIQRRETRGRGT